MLNLLKEDFLFSECEWSKAMQRKCNPRKFANINVKGAMEKGGKAFK